MRVFIGKSASASLHRRALMLCGVVLLGVATAAGAAEADTLTIGGVIQEEYKGALGKVGASENPLKHQDAVYSQEQVTTPPWGTTSLQFLDGTQLQVGEASDVTLDEFVYDPNQTLTSAAIKFNRGVFRFITGENTRKEGVSLTTPVATLSIRGTDLLIKVAYDGTTTVSVLKGAIAALACDRPEQIVSAGQVLKIPNNCSEKSTLGPYTPAAPGGPDTSPGPGNDHHQESRSNNNG